MRKIIEFLGRFGNILTFILLELISFFVIIRVNSPHRELSQAFFLQLSGKFSEAKAAVTDYFGLRTENSRLQQENNDLKTRLLQMTNELSAFKSQGQMKTGFTLLPDSVVPSMGFYFLPANAINNTTYNNYNYITLNKGRRHGVSPNMGVVSPLGVAGRVIEVSEDYSLALSLLNLKFKLSSKLLRIQNIGTLSWDGGEPEFATLNFIPQTSGLQIGDTVVTSGYGTTFPENFMIGTVSYFDTRDQNGFYFIKVKLSSDFRSLGNLYLVGHNEKNQIDSLETIAAQDQ